MFTKSELANILALIKSAPITGEQALTVAVLQQKIQAELSKKPVAAAAVTPKKK